MDAKQQFIEEYAPIAEDVGRKIGVSPDILLSQWGLETRWGTSVIGSHNLGNIKDFAGGGKKADGEKYMNFEDPEAFGDYYAHMIKRNFPEAVNTRSDIGKFAEGLQSGKKGGYAEDPNYAESLATVLDTTRSIYEPPKEGAAEAEPEDPSVAVDELVAGGAGAVGAGALGKMFPEPPLPGQVPRGLENAVKRQGSRVDELVRQRAAMGEPPVIQQPAGRPPMMQPPAGGPVGGPVGGPAMPGATLQQGAFERGMQGAPDEAFGTTGRARQETYNTETARRAAAARGVDNPFTRQTWGATPSGVLAPPEVAQQATQRADAAQQLVQQEITRAREQAKSINQLDRQIETARRNLDLRNAELAELRRRAPGPLAKIGAFFRSPMGKMIPGAAAGVEAEEARQRYQKGDILGALAAGSGALGAGMMAAPVPIPAVKALGAALGYGGPLALAAIEAARERGYLPKVEGESEPLRITIPYGYR
jgi:hypothetical protein